MNGARKISPIGVRLPPELRAKLEERAAENCRSLNGELIVLLSQALGVKRERKAA